MRCGQTVPAGEGGVLDGGRVRHCGECPAWRLQKDPGVVLDHRVHQLDDRRVQVRAEVARIGPCLEHRNENHAMRSVGYRRLTPGSGQQQGRRGGPASSPGPVALLAPANAGVLAFRNQPAACQTSWQSPR